MRNLLIAFSLVFSSVVAHAFACWPNQIAQGCKTVESNCQEVWQSDPPSCTPDAVGGYTCTTNPPMPTRVCETSCVCKGRGKALFMEVMKQNFMGSCQSTYQCPSYQHCLGGQCVDANNANQCGNAHPCGYGESCIDGVCQ